MSIRARAWIALLVPPVTWFLFQQGLSALLHTDCTRSNIGLIWGVASLLLCGLSLRIGWSLHRHQGTLADPWLARLAMVLTGIFVLAVAFQTLAILLVPPCVR